MAPETGSCKLARKHSLYYFPPEIRKELFKAAINQFFQEHPESQDLNYGKCKSDRVQLLSNIGMNTNGRVFGGLEEDHLPALEIALFPDGDLHEEFIRTRIEMSTLLLTPCLKTAVHAFGVEWPSVKDVSAKVRGSVRAVAYETEYWTPDSPTFWSQTFEISQLTHEPDLLTMKRLGNVFHELLIQRQLAKTNCDPQTSSGTLGHYDLQVPHLQKIIVRFKPSGGGLVPDYVAYSEEATYFGDALRSFATKAELKSFEFQDMRKLSFSRDEVPSPSGDQGEGKIPESNTESTEPGAEPEVDGDADEYSNQRIEIHDEEIGVTFSDVGFHHAAFEDFTKVLDKSLRCSSELRVTLDHRIDGFERDPEPPNDGMYRFAQTWTTKGQYLGSSSIEAELDR